MRFSTLSLLSLLLCGLNSVGCGDNTPTCPDSYGACQQYALETNQRHEDCGSDLRLVVEEVCDESLADPDICLDCVDYYECFTERTQCVEGSIELETVDCPACGAATSS